jgi:sigma-B regulation protein RsbU (phosphoserine phosphatase)
MQVHPGEPYGDVTRSYRTFSVDGVPIPEAQTAVSLALSGTKVRGVSYKIAIPDGREIFVSMSAAPVRGPRGRIIGATTVFRDIRDRIEFERRKEEVFEREHRIAEVLQQALVPPKVDCEVPGYDVATRYQPGLAEAEVGGDFYDIFELDGGQFGLIVGDVAGKGLTAAIRVAAARHSVRSYAFLDPDPAVALTRANAALSKEETEGGGMLTAFFAVVDASAHTVTYASGGHEPALILSADGSIQELGVAGCPMGVLDTFSYASESLSLKPGDRLIVFTDGITEARSREAGFFGQEGVRDYLALHTELGAQELATGLLDAAVRHARGSLQDDAAIVVFERRTDA